ncbi:NFU domain protein 1 [Hibiscus syriacus]|uniref:NFU domain protein 1 n=1 Tax=Hibiscus syriacus TaxID=106335 RepID=A0A6A2Y6T3_HIBSY|nr:NFU domain protein 1 [Hibiscus syriacus]
MVNPSTGTDPFQQQPFFTKGAPVEVSSDDEGFRGAWYSATILEIPPKSASKKRKKALVKYKTLLADDGSSPLTEHVDPAYIRPLPPNDKGTAHLDVNDVVDASYRDGWWTGVVRKVFKKSKYRVYFDNPPDVIEFDREALRVHWSWIDGRWVRPEKLQSTGSIFSSGTTVEVNIENENIGYIWYPAIVIKENEDNTFLVKYQNSMNDDESGTVKVVVDSLHIRPAPPRYADRNYELLERVDATYNFGWRSGVITKVLTGRRYNVFFKHGNEDKEFCHSDIRPNVEWMDGKWISKSKVSLLLHCATQAIRFLFQEVIIVSDEQEQIGIAPCGTQKTKVDGELESSLSTKENTQDKTPLTKMNKNAVEKSTSTDESNALKTSKKKVKLETSNGNTSLPRPSKKLAEGNAVETPVSVIGNKLKDIEGNPRTSGKGAKFSKKTVIGDEPCDKIESPTTGATTQIASNDCLFCQHHRSNRTTKRPKAGSADSTTNNLVKRNVRARKSPSKGPQGTTAATYSHRYACNGATEGTIKTKESEMPIVIGLTAVTKTLQAEHSLQIPSEEPQKLMGDQKNNVNDSVRNENMEGKEHKVGASDLKKNRGRPTRSVVTGTKVSDAVGKEQNGAGGITDENAVKDCTSSEAGLSKHKGVELLATEDSRGRTNDNYKTKEVHLTAPGISDMVEDDQPLSTWIGGMHTSGDEESRLHSARLVNGWNEEKGLVDVPIESLTIDASDRSSLINDQSLPFVKRSPVWRTIESMDIFLIVPQNPHFLPLAESKEEFREGSAIGIMVTFASLFEKISMLHFDEPRDTFDSISESLSDLEKHGFDVTMLQCRLNKLLSIKERHDQQLEERQNAEREIVESTKEISKFDEEMEVIERKITQLQEQHASIKSEKETKNLKVDNLKSHVSVLNKLTQNASHEFKKIATASWKLL